MSEDTIYSKKINRISDFAFDEQVASVFDDMLYRSIPAYRELIAMMGVFAQRFYQNDTLCYDLGCSLGASSISIAKSLQGRSVRIIAVDSSQAMLDRCQHTLQHNALDQYVETRLADITQLSYEPASLIVLNFTLQFIAPQQRSVLLDALYRCLVPGGALVLSEKCHSDDAQAQTFIEQLYYQFKKANGYSELEIAQKREALEKVLMTQTPEDHLTTLQGLGFKEVYCWFHSFQFHSFVAVKQ